jgi:hypothetical protein
MSVPECTHKFAMSALPPKADSHWRERDVFVPLAEIAASMLRPYANMGLRKT